MMRAGCDVIVGQGVEGSNYDVGKKFASAGGR